MMLPGVVPMFIGLEEPKFTTFSIDSVTVITSSLYCSSHCQKSCDFSCNCCGSIHSQNLFKPVACINGCFNKYDQCSKKQENQVELLDHEVKSARPYVAWVEDNLSHGPKSFHRSKKHWQTWCCMHSPFELPWFQSSSVRPLYFDRNQKPCNNEPKSCMHYDKKRTEAMMMMEGEAAGKREIA